MSQYPYITVTKGMAGFFAVMIWWNPDGFEEPYDTGDGRYALQSDAIAEGMQWAAAEELRFIVPALELDPTRQDFEQQIKEIIPDIQIIHVVE